MLRKLFQRTPAPSVATPAASATATTCPCCSHRLTPRGTCPLCSQVDTGFDLDGNEYFNVCSCQAE